MAEHNVSFLRYSQSGFDALTTKNPYTFYLVESTNPDGGFHYDLYLGNERLDNSAEVVAATEQLNALIDGKVAKADFNALKAKVDAITGNGEEGDIESLAGLKGYVDSQIDTLEQRDATLQGDIDDIAENIGTTNGKISTLEDQMSSANGSIAALQETVGDSTKGLVKSVAELQAKDTSLENKIDDEIARATTKEAELNTAITNLTTNKADKSTFESEILRLGGLITAEEVKSEDFEDRISTMETFWEAAEVDEEGKSVIDTLVEIQEYITNDKTGAAAMMELINANKSAHEENAKDIAQVRTDFAAADTDLENTLKSLISAHVQEFTTHTAAFETYKTAQEALNAGQDVKIQALETKDTELVTAINAAESNATTEAARLDGELKEYVDGKLETINNGISSVNQALGTKAESGTVTSEVSRLESLISALETSVKGCYSREESEKTFATIENLKITNEKVQVLTEALTWKPGQ